MEFSKSVLPNARAFGGAGAALVALGMSLSGCCGGVMCRGMDEAGVGMMLPPGHFLVEGMRSGGTTTHELQLLAGRRCYGSMPWIDLATTTALTVLAFFAGREWRRAGHGEVEID
jgi:hypothetical protein